ncbi:MAG TPA: hypothetical protein VGV38_00100, partial [Pyrinomonadaceae bacterium]|nr:hypothetical protein [Pyrinomonadaceae bacterium]
ELMRQAESLFPGRRVSFLVCSNAEHVGGAFEGFRHTRGTGHLVEDLYALAGCDYLVGPPSTFTMWASLYGGVPLCMVEDPRRALRLEDFAVYLGDERAGAAEPAVTSS